MGVVHKNAETQENISLTSEDICVIFITEKQTFVWRYILILGGAFYGKW